MQSRSCLLLYNTVERLLRGDLFHCVDIDQLNNDLKDYPEQWNLVGLGTSNWYERNGELVIAGVSGSPDYMWGDPLSTPLPGKLVDLGRSTPELVDLLKTPVEGQDPTLPYFPFAAVGLCPPDDRRTWEIPADTYIHTWIEDRITEENIGLAAVYMDAVFDDVAYTTMCNIPLGGLALSEGYSGDDTFNFGAIDDECWDLRGIVAINPTIQNMVSLTDHPLHLHGFSTEAGIGGHVNTARTREASTLSVWPLKDLVLKINDLDVLWLPVREVAD